MRSAGNPGTRCRWPIALLVCAAAFTAQTAGAQSVTWKSWTFDYALSGYKDGLSLANVTFQGRALIRKISLPVVRVFYDNNACGPFADRLGGWVLPIPWMNNAKLAQREFTFNNLQWYEIGIRDSIGNYDLYQVYYLSEDGTIDAHIYSKGLQCHVNHIHYPNWRIDFDLDGAGADQIQRKTADGYEVMDHEFNANATAALDHGWRVRDVVTGLAMDVLPGFPDFSIPDGTVVPVDSYSDNTVFGRLYRDTEDRAWRYGPNSEVPFNEGEFINDADTVFWYQAYMPHNASDGSALWHSTGVRLVTNFDAGPPPAPTPTPTPRPPFPPGWTGTASFPGHFVSIFDRQAGAPYPSTVTITGMGGMISKVTATLAGLTHTYPADLDILLVGPGGQSSMLLSDAGGTYDIYDVSLTFDADAPTTLTSGSQIVTGTYKPVNYGLRDRMPLPAPAGLLPANLAVFNGLDPNGTWSLYVLDDASRDVGFLAAGS